MGAKDLLTGSRRAAVQKTLPILLLGLLTTVVLPAIARPNTADAEAGSQRRRTPGLVRPRRLTIGNHNHFMGVLGPGARYLYYVTDEYNSYDLHVQSPINTAGKPLFEAFGDVVLPAISPDGDAVAYLRYETDSQGDACRRRIRQDGSVRGNREECRATDEADLQIHWRKDGRLGVLLREELHGDHILLDGAFEKKPERKESNVVGLAFSPDERWAAYVPLARLREDIGVSFSNQIGQEGLRVRRVTESSSEFSYKPRLPGLSANPVFSPGGDYLYFSQFLNDTNQDGVIDGDDNGVLFRVTFDGTGDKPRFGQPKQLTNARWNCHYPSVQERTMAVTCAIAQNLHIYLLPPSGAVPADWDRERIAQEAEIVRDRWSELLLRQHLLVGAGNDRERTEQLQVLTKLHLDLREYEAAVYYGEWRQELLRRDGHKDPWSELVILLAKHQRADRALSRGRFSEEYVQESTSRAEAVKSVDIGQSADAAALRSVVLSKIYSDLGDKAFARETVDRIQLGAVRDETVLDFAYQQFYYFYGLIADQERRLERVKDVALHPAPSVTESLRHCKGFVDLIQRGRPKEERLSRLIDARRTVPDQTRLAFVLDVEIALCELTEENAKRAEELLVELYRKLQHPHARRYLVVAAFRAARRQGVESLQHSLADLWVRSVEEADPHRQASTSLYGLVVMERAYGALAAADDKTAANYFDRARRRTGSLAGHVGWIESQRELHTTEELTAHYSAYFDQEATGSDSLRNPAARRFVEAYLLARDLGSFETNDGLKKTVKRMRELLEAAIEEDPHQPLSHLLLAHAMHHQSMRLGEREDMALAVRHYLMTLDLAENRPRVRAPAHSGLALAQAALGNHRRALEDYEARLKLPMISKEEEFGLLLHYARSLFHVDRRKVAIDTLQAALVMMHTETNASAAEAVRRYEPLVLDRLALYQLADGRTEDALRTHDDLKRWLRLHPEALSTINEIKNEARIATAHLAAGHPKRAMHFASQGQTSLAAADPLRPDDIDRRVRPVTHEFVYDENQLRVLLSGLEANAAREVGDLTRTRAALLRRKAAVRERYDDQKVDEDVLELAHTCLRLAEVAQQRGDLEETQRFLEEGLAYAQEHSDNTGSEVSEVGFHLLRAYAQLHFAGAVPLESYERDLEADLLRYYLFLSEVRNPKWEPERKRFEIYLALVRMEKSSEP